MPRQNEDVNEIWICDKGRFAHHYAESRKRLSYPTARRNGEQVPASWDEATKLAADKFREAKKDLVGWLRVDYPMKIFQFEATGRSIWWHGCLYSRMGGGELTSLVGVSNSNFANIGAGSAIVVAASDLYQEAPIWYLRVKQAADRGATLIVLNPRETKLDRHASFAVRYAYGDEAKSVQDLSKAEKISDAIKQAQNVVVLYGSEGLGVRGSASLASACASLLQETGFAGKATSGLIGVWNEPMTRAPGNWVAAWKRIWRLPLQASPYTWPGWIR